MSDLQPAINPKAMKTYNPKLAELKAAIQKAVPEIMELRFGCEISRKGSLRNYKVIEDIGFAANASKVWINSVPFGTMPIELEKDLIEKGGEFEILGRPITLADVLLTIFGQNLNHLGGIMSEDYMKAGEIIAWWNLKSFLDGQSEETIDFLHNLLTTTKPL